MIDGRVAACLNTACCRRQSYMVGAVLPEDAEKATWLLAGAVGLLRSPMGPTFREFVSRLETRCVICSPYVTAQPIDTLLSTLERKRLTKSIRLSIVTDIAPDNLTDGSTDVTALQAVLECVEQAEISYVPRIHAKVYVANDDTAMIGSFNCTNGGLFANLEYGVLVRDIPTVAVISDDVGRFAQLGGRLTRESLGRISRRVEELRHFQERTERTRDPELVKLTDEVRQATADELIRVRVTGKTVHAIFTDTVLYLLRRGEMTTRELHEQVRAIHPDLCDDSVDRVIEGERFGKLWKHQVRTAQAHLRRQGRIERDAVSERWRLVDA